MEALQNALRPNVNVGVTENAVSKTESPAMCVSSVQMSYCAQLRKARGENNFQGDLTLQLLDFGVLIG